MRLRNILIGNDAVHHGFAGFNIFNCYRNIVGCTKDLSRLHASSVILYFYVSRYINGKEMKNKAERAVFQSSVRPGKGVLHAVAQFEEDLIQCIGGFFF